MKRRKRITIKRILRYIFSYFIQGLIYIAPISLTVFVIYKAFLFFDSLFPSQIPGIGILLFIISVTLFGFIGSLLVVRPIFKYFDTIFQEIPFIKIIYTSIKDFLSAFVGAKKKFSEPVLVKMSCSEEIYKMGFVTRKDLEVIRSDKKLVAVYMPHSYNFSGNLVFVPSEHISPLNIPPSEALKFIVSGGVTDIKYDEDKNNSDIF